MILGLQWKALPVTKEDGYSFRGATLRAAIDEDLKAGLMPFMVIGSVGTTSSGAVDAIAELGAVGMCFATPLRNRVLTR